MGTKLDLLIVNPCSRSRVYQALGTELAAAEPPVWARLLAAFCIRRGLSVEILDAEAEGLGGIEIAKHVESSNPTLTTVVVFGHQPSASTQNMTAAGEVCRAIKDSNEDRKVILIGGHVAALPHRTLREEKADFVAAGEGFYTLLGLVEALQSPISDLSKIPGLGYRSGNEIKINADVPLIDNLDQEVPGDLGWNLLPMGKYRAHNWHCLDGSDRQPYAAIYTTLGCPYRCSFCCIQAPFRQGERAAGMQATSNSYRYWSPKHVLSAIDLLVNRYGVRNIKIADEMFVLNRKHVEAICSGIRERKYDLNLWAYARVDSIKDGMLGPLRDAGFSWLALGIESGSHRVRADVDKKFHQNKVFEVLHQIRSAGINTIGNYIFGLPEDDHNTMQATLDLAIELNCEFGNFYSTMAYPGSPLYSQAVRKGLPLPERWTGYSQHAKDCLPLPTRYLTSQQVLQFRDDAFHQYYTNPTYLEMIHRRFGPDTVADLRNMTSVRLERDLLAGTLKSPPMTRKSVSIKPLTSAPMA